MHDSSAMEAGVVWDVNLLLELLSETIEELNQLEADVGEPQKPNAQKIQDKLKKAFSIAKMCPENWSNAAASVSPPRSSSSSPRSENSQKVFKEKEQREMCKKRRALNKWTSQARILPNGESEGMDDGHSWRKYGQKDILGAKHPRAYYRCTNRHTAGCPATKQVQQSDADPSIVDITYVGEHTCLRAQKPSEPTMQQKYQEFFVSKEPNHHDQDEQLLLSFQKKLKVETKELFAEDQPMAFFSFPPTPVSHLKPENHFFSSPSTLESNYVVGASSSFASPATSESNYYSVSPPILQAPDSELNEVIRAATSTIHSNFMFEHQEYDNIFNLDSPNFF